LLRQHVPLAAGIGVCMGVMYVVAGCFPVVATAIALVPSSVMGAAFDFCHLLHDSDRY